MIDASPGNETDAFLIYFISLSLDADRQFLLLPQLVV